MPKEEVEILPPDGADPTAWMLTFSDLLTLMLTFFVLLFSMSSLDSKALKEITDVDVLSGGDGVMEAGDPDRIEKPKDIEPVKVLRTFETTLTASMAQYLRTIGRGKSDSTRRELEERLANRKMQDDVEVRVLDDGLELSFDEDEEFFSKTGRDQLDDRARAKLQLISDAMVESGARSVVSMPTTGTGLSQWLAAGKKSSQVAVHLRRQSGVPVGRSRVSVYTPKADEPRKVRIKLTMPQYSE
ncbi:MAG: hypothetical protein CMH50_15350 [Myxococcales bacterium]|jgi:chemotaxis protein MotB|nr:hypothetical protein [Myxococcales bacterium]|tara:strand:- start:1978 stop:2706 length:729 start_codon:yes stop_codon:yes gene_type:complete